MYQTRFAILTPIVAMAILAAGPAAAQVERLDPRLDALIPEGATIERLADGFSWAEGPVWNPADGSVLFSDVVQNRVIRWKEGEGASVYLEPSGYSGSEPFTGREPGSNGLAIDSEGRLVLAQHGDRRIVRREADGSLTVIADRYAGGRLHSPNDLVLGPDGDLYFTDPPFGLPGGFNSPLREQEHNGVYHVAADGTVTLLTADIPAPNGIAISPDGGTLYVSNAQGNNPIWMAYPILGPGRIGEGRTFADARTWGGGRGVPDGMKVDVDGNVYATGAGGVHIFSPDGTRLGRIDTGVPTANLAWGDDGSTLYITANDTLVRIRTTTRGPGF